VACKVADSETPPVTASAPLSITINPGGGGNNPPAGFLISRNKGFTVSTGSNPDFSWFEPQTGGPFSNASVNGTYVL
jgi:hypothetical protein